MGVRRKGLSERERESIALLVAGVSQYRAAEEVGVHRTTLARWERRPEFREALARATDEAVEAISRQSERELALLLGSDDAQVAFQTASRVVDMYLRNRR